MKQTKKKKRSKSGALKRVKDTASAGDSAGSEEQTVVNNLTEDFACISLEKAVSAFSAANVDAEKAAAVVENANESMAEEESSRSSGTFDVGSSSGSSESYAFADAANDCFLYGVKQKGKPKVRRVVATAGTVSTMLGKDYVRSTPRKSSSKLKGLNEDYWSQEDAEQFLCSMLGDECELSLAVVRDVLCQCGYDVEKAVNILLEFSTSQNKQSKFCEDAANQDDPQRHLESSVNLTKRTSESISNLSENELQDNVWFAGHVFRNQPRGSLGASSNCLTERRNLESELPQKVLESLFNMPVPKTAEHEQSTMNWKNVVKRMASLGQGVESNPGENAEQVQHSCAKEDDYEVLRETAKQHWESVKSYYKKAGIAYSNGNKEYAAYLSEQGRRRSEVARKADEKASQDIFQARNRDIDNIITIDLHGQHLKQAMRLLKLHLMFGACVRSVRLFRVITGCGSHGVGKSKLKHAVINLLQNEGIVWREENRGTLLVRLNGQTNFSFVDSDSDDG